MIELVGRLRSAWSAHVFAEHGRPGAVGATALALGALLPLALATSPTVALTSLFWDIFVPLDGGWRVASGQVPHVDFHTPVGPLYVWAYGLGMQAFGTDGRVVLLVPALLAAPFALLAWWLTRDRLPGVLRVATTLLVGLLVCSPAQLDEMQLVHLASYNRVGAAMALLVAIGACLEPRSRSRAEVADAVVSALLLAGLFYLKVTLFGLAVGALGLAVLAVPGTRRASLLGLGVGGAAVALPFALSPLPWAYLADVKRSIDAKDAAFEAAYAAAGFAHLAPGPVKLLHQLGENAVTLSVSLGLAAWLVASAGPQARRTALVVLGLVGGTLLVALQSHDRYAPGLVAAVLVAAQAAVRRGRGGWGAVAVALALAPMAGRGLHDARGILVHAGLSRAPTGLWPLTSDGPGSALRIVGKPGTLSEVVAGRRSLEDWRRAEDITAEDLALVVREGLRALEAHAPADAKVLSVQFSSPFPYLRGAPPARGGLAWYHPGRTFGGRAPIDPDVLLAEVDVVLVPRLRDNRPGEPPVTQNDIEREGLWSAIGPTVQRDFRRVDTPLWEVWLREGQGSLR